MSIQVFTLEQVCKESAGWETFQTSNSGSGSLNDHFNRNPSLPYAWKLHEVLRHLATTLTLPLPFDEWLRSLATLTVQAMKVDLCVIMLTDHTHNCLRASVCVPDLAEKSVVMQPVNVEPALWERLRTFTIHGQLPSLAAHELAALNPLKNVQYEILIPIPLIVGSEYIGLINCYASKIPHYSEDDQLIVSTIANQTALAIKYRQCMDEETLTQKTLIKAFVNDLLSGSAEQEELLRRRAHSFGYDLSQPGLVALMEWSEVEKSAYSESLAVSRQERLLLGDGMLRQLQQFLRKFYPDALVDERGNLLVCLLRLSDQNARAVKQLQSRLSELIDRLQIEHSVQLSVGLSNLCYVVSDYRRGYAEAHEALGVGQCLHQAGSCTHFNDLGADRYLYKFAHMDTLRDQYQEQIAAIVEYDQRKKTNLLDTLDIYLECGGNVARTSNLLQVHRNTLLQRLERLQKLCTLDLEQRQNRLPLLVALKVHKLRTSGRI